MKTEDQQEFLNTLEWKGSPGQLRHGRARKFLNGDTRGADEITRRDASILETLDQTPEYRAWAMARIRESGEYWWNPNWIISGYRIEETAMRGCGEEFIGVAILLDGSDPSEGTISIGCTFTRIHRDPDWMGADEILEMLDGLMLHIREWDYRPGEPAMVIACESDFRLNADIPEDGIPSETGLRLDVIARERGALGSLWYAAAPGERGEAE